MLRLLLIGILLIFASAFLIHYWEDIDNEIRFLSYYDKPAQKYGLDEIQVLLGTLHELPDAYEADKFDCTEMSAYLEWRLENYGYHTKIVMGRALERKYFRHVWLMVEFERGIYIPIEATTCQIIMPDNPYFEDYYIYDEAFESIKEAMRHKPSDFDWWNQEE